MILLFKTSSSRKSGQSMLAALAALGVVTTTVFVAPKISNILSKQSRGIRIRSSMIAAENSIRQQFFESSQYKNSCLNSLNRSYQNCFEGNALLSADGTLKHYRSLIGAQCPIALPGCGLSVKVTEDSVNQLVNFEIQYLGTENIVSPRTFALDFSKLTSIQSCSPSTPWFEGLDKEGNAICKNFPTCPAGFFWVGQNANDLSPICASIDAAPVACPEGQKIKKISWIVSGIPKKLRAQLECELR